MKKFFGSVLGGAIILGGGCMSRDQTIYDKDQLINSTTKQSSMPIASTTESVGNGINVRNVTSTATSTESNRTVKSDEVTIYNQDEKNSQHILQILTENKNITEVKKPSNIQIPKNFLEEQFDTFFELENFTFALVQGPSSNTFFDEKKQIPSGKSFSGVWYIEKGDQEWKPFFEIKNKEEYYVLNNPFYLWNEGKKLSLLVSDDKGAGSGEGTGKVLASEDGGKNWKIERCFYFVPDNFFEKHRALGVNFLPWFEQNLRTDFDKGGIVGYGFEYTYNSSTNNFVKQGVVNKWSQDVVMVQADECKSITL